MKISNLLTAISAVSLSQFGEAVDNFPHTGTSLVEKNPYPPVRKDIARSLRSNAQSHDDISLANENEDIPGCAHMDIYTLCDVAEIATDADGFITSTSYSKDCKASNDFFCLEEAMITYDVCVNENDIVDDIFSGIELDLSTVNQYFQFKLMLNGMEQAIDPESYSISSKGLCLRYQTNVYGCKDALDLTAGVVFFPDGENIDSQDDQCTGNDPFALQVRNLQEDNPERLERRSITLTLPEVVYSKKERLRLLNLPEGGTKEAALYVKQTLTRCLAFIDESNDNQSDGRNLKPSECQDKKKKFKIKSKEKQFVYKKGKNKGKRKKFNCKKLGRLGLLNMKFSNNVCEDGIKGEKRRQVKDKCVNSCDNCPSGDSTADLSTLGTPNSPNPNLIYTEIVDLGTASNYVILASSGISTVPNSVVTGDIAVSPIAAAAITGFNLAMDTSNTFSTDSQIQLKGKAFAPNYGGSTAAELTVAVLDVMAAYTNAAGRSSEASKMNIGGGEIGGQTLTPGVYTFVGNVLITGADLTFYGSSTDVFIIRTTGSLIQAANTRVELTGGALAENIFWQVAGVVSVGVGSHLEGILLAKTTVTFFTGSSLNGRILSMTAVTLQKANITEKPSTSDSISSTPSNQPQDSSSSSPTNNPTLPPLRSSDLLGCKFLFDAKNDITPFALGPLKLSTNVLNAIGITGYPRNKYTPIYEDFFIPELITNSCIEFDGSIGNIKSSVITYSNSESYSKQLAKANSISIDGSVKGKGGGIKVTARAGYAQSTKREIAGTGFSRSAYGRRQTVKEIAKISINCLNKESFVDLELQDLVKPEVVEDWRFIREFSGTKGALRETPQFQRVSLGGFLQPTTYLYSATVRLSTDTLYTEKSSSDSSDVSREITASLSAKYKGLGGSGSVTASTAVSNAVSKGLTESGINSRSETIRIATGTPSITSTCLLGIDASSTAPNCEEVVTQEVATVFQDINNFVTVPSEQIGSVSLDEIVKGYFNDDIGLGVSFFEAVDERYSDTSEIGRTPLQEGNVYLNIFLQEFGCVPPNVTNTVLNDRSAQFLLKLNKCTIIKRGPPKSIYLKVSIKERNYIVTQASNDDCIPADADDEFLFPFGECVDGDSTPVLDDIFGLFQDDINRGNGSGDDKDTNLNDFSVFLSDYKQPESILFNCDDDEGGDGCILLNQF